MNTLNQNSSIADLAQVQPYDEHNRSLVQNVHPLDWVNPEPAARYNMVVVGGAIAGAWNQFHAAMERSLNEYIFELPAAQLQVVPAKLGSDAPLLGAAAMAAALPATAAQ